MFHASMHGGPKYNHGIYLYMFIYIYTISFSDVSQKCGQAPWTLALWRTFGDASPKACTYIVIRTLLTFWPGSNFILCGRPPMHELGEQWARGKLASMGGVFLIYIYIIKKGSCPVPLPSTPQSPIQFQLGSWASHVWLYHDDFNHLFANQISSPSQYKLTKARDRWLLPLSPLAPAPSRPQWPLAPALVTARDSCFAAMLQWPYSVMEQGDWEWALRVWSEESHAYETEWVRYEDHEQMILKNLVCILCSSCIDNWSGG